MRNGNCNSTWHHRCNWCSVCLGGSENTAGCVMDVAQDFRKLLAEGVAKNAFSEQQTRDLEQLLYDYDTAVRTMLYSLNSMDRLITHASKKTLTV